MPMGLPGGPARDHDATPRAHPYGKRVRSLVGSLRSGRVTAGAWQRIASPSWWCCVQSPFVPVVLGAGPSVPLFGAILAVNHPM